MKWVVGWWVCIWWVCWCLVLWGDDEDVEFLVVVDLCDVFGYDDWVGVVFVFGVGYLLVLG